MRWPVVAVFTYVFIGLELALRPELKFGQTGVGPSLLIPFLTFVALYAPARPMLFLAMIVGSVIDLTTPHPMADSVPGSAGPTRTLTLLGPHALGFLAAAYLTITLRSVMVRRNPLTLVVLSIAGSMLTQLVITAIFSLRALYDPPLASPGTSVGKLATIALDGAATGAAAMLLAVILIPCTRLMGFHDPQARRYGH